LYDPTGEYLDPPLQGFRLAGSDYAAIEPSAAALRSAELGILLRLEQRDLVLIDERTKEILMTKAEAMDAARQAEATARQAEAAARQAAQQRAEQLQAEVDRLKKELERGHQ
jgi:hypothetical protein